eukprot:TRINITY_DN1321_c1_g1_i22.p1 TRINITY_DN1321_c1_g1~~TRINITY_DN1321_c1_g1_i22.p1  ORF type:complete len:965 (+),score=185.63 TRINITY_DN1321_c1_g1_i22:417-3311(+)
MPLGSLRELAVYARRVAPDKHQPVAVLRVRGLGVAPLLQSADAHWEPATPEDGELVHGKITLQSEHVTVCVVCGLNTEGEMVARCSHAAAARLAGDAPEQERLPESLRFQQRLEEARARVKTARAERLASEGIRQDSDARASRRSVAGSQVADRTQLYLRRFQLLLADFEAEDRRAVPPPTSTENEPAAAADAGLDARQAAEAVASLPTALQAPQPAEDGPQAPVAQAEEGPQAPAASEAYEGSAYEQATFVSDDLHDPLLPSQAFRRFAGRVRHPQEGPVSSVQRDRCRHESPFVATNDTVDTNRAQAFGSPPAALPHSGNKATGAEARPKRLRMQSAPFADEWEDEQLRKKWAKKQAGKSKDGSPAETGISKRRVYITTAKRRFVRTMSYSSHGSSALSDEDDQTTEPSTPATQQPTTEPSDSTQQDGLEMDDDELLDDNDEEPTETGESGGDEVNHDKECTKPSCTTFARDSITLPESYRGAFDGFTAAVELANEGNIRPEQGSFKPDQGLRDVLENIWTPEITAVVERTIAQDRDGLADALEKAKPPPLPESRKPTPDDEDLRKSVSELTPVEVEAFFETGRLPSTFPQKDERDFQSACEAYYGGGHDPIQKQDDSWAKTFIGAERMPPSLQTGFELLKNNLAQEHIDFILKIMALDKQPVERINGDTRSIDIRSVAVDNDLEEDLGRFVEEVKRLLRSHLKATMPFGFRGKLRICNLKILVSLPGEGLQALHADFHLTGVWSGLIFVTAGPGTEVCYRRHGWCDLLASRNKLPTGDFGKTAVVPWPRDPRPLHVERGQIGIMAPMVVHRGPLNNTDKDRVAVFFSIDSKNGDDPEPSDGSPVLEWQQEQETRWPTILLYWLWKPLPAYSASDVLEMVVELILQCSHPTAMMVVQAFLDCKLVLPAAVQRCLRSVVKAEAVSYDARHDGVCCTRMTTLARVVVNMLTQLPGSKDSKLLRT